VSCGLLPLGAEKFDLTMKFLGWPTKLIGPRIKVAAASTLLMVLVGCVGNSNGGYTVGMVNSPFWYRTAPKAEILNYFTSKTTVALCSKWAANWDGTSLSVYKREWISKALVARGASGMFCYDPQADQIEALNAGVRANAAAIRANAAEAKKNADRAAQFPRRR